MIETQKIPVFRADSLTAKEKCELLKVIDHRNNKFTFVDFYKKYEDLVKKCKITFVGKDSTLREWCIKEGWWIPEHDIYRAHWNGERIDSELGRLSTEVYEQEPITRAEYNKLKQQNELLIQTLEYLLNELKK